MMKVSSISPVLSFPLILALAGCGGGGSGGGSAGNDGGAEEAPDGTLPTLSERQSFAEGVINEQQAIVAAGAADPADLATSSASYAGRWAMSLDPGGDLEIVGGSVALEADFFAGTLDGTMEQEILAGADGTLTIENGQVSGADLAGDLRGNLDDPNGGVIAVDTSVDGFVSDTGAQGTMSGTATRDGESVGAQGAFAAEQTGGGAF